MKTISVADAVALIPDGATLMIGGFMGVGTPEGASSMKSSEQGKRNLTVIANDTAVPGRGIRKTCRSWPHRTHRGEPHRPQSRDAEADDRGEDGG